MKGHAAAEVEVQGGVVKVAPAGGQQRFDGEGFRIALDQPVEGVVGDDQADALLVIVRVQVRHAAEPGNPQRIGGFLRVDRGAWQQGRQQRREQRQHAPHFAPPVAPAMRKGGREARPGAVQAVRCLAEGGGLGRGVRLRLGVFDAAGRLGGLGVQRLFARGRGFGGGDGHQAGEGNAKRREQGPARQHRTFLLGGKGSFGNAPAWLPPRACWAAWLSFCASNGL